MESWLNTRKQRVRQDELFTSCLTIVQYIIFYVFPRKRDRKRQEITTKKKMCSIKIINRFKLIGKEMTQK